jgi:hypothetical protein
LDIQEKNVMQAANIEVFNKLLHKDGFEAIAEYFKKGSMTAPPELLEEKDWTKNLSNLNQRAPLVCKRVLGEQFIALIINEINA